LIHGRNTHAPRQVNSSERRDFRRLSTCGGAAVSGSLTEPVTIVLNSGRAMTRSWHQYEGQRISETFPLHRYLGGDGNHAVFLTEYGEPAPRKAAIKIVLGDPETTDLQLHLWNSCRDQNGSEPWACENCDCTERLECKLATLGDPFLKVLRGSQRLP
jgi:hypothetical protein